MQNLATFALAIPEIRLQASKLKIGHVTLNVPFLRWFVMHNVRLDIIYLFAKFDHLASAIKEISLGAKKFKVSHVTLTMPLLSSSSTSFIFRLKVHRNYNETAQRTDRKHTEIYTKGHIKHGE